MQAIYLLFPYFSYAMANAFARALAYAYKRVPYAEEW